jgi:hypothetical protein
MGKELTYNEYPIKNLDSSERVTRSKVIRMCKVQWSHHTEEEATWEREDELKEDFPQLFSKSSESRDEILFKGGRICDTLKFHHYNSPKQHVSIVLRI